MANKKWSAFSIILGCVFIGYAFLIAIVSRTFTDPLVYIHFGIGVLVLVYWFIWGRNKTAKLDGKKSNTSKKVYAFLHTAFDVVAALIIVICINYLAYRYDKRYDSTEEGVYSLAPETRDVLSHLNCPVHITAVIDPNRRGEYEDAYDLLNLYTYYKKKYISFEILDPRKHPYRIEKELGLRSDEKIAIDYQHKTDPKTARASVITEEIITNAIAKMINGNEKNLYYVVGHGEPDLLNGRDDGIKKAITELKDNGINVKTIVLAERLGIPDDAIGVLLVSPQKNLLAVEEQVLEQYIREGGGVLMLSDPDGSNSIADMAKNFGIEVGKNVILDKVQGLQGAPEVGWQIVVREYLKHPITEHFVNGDYSVFLLSSTVTPAPAERRDPQGEYNPFVLVKSNSAWAESNLDLLLSNEPKAQFDFEEDVAAPFSLAVAYEKKVQSGRGSRLVVFGDSNWIRNPNLNIYANKKLFLNAVNWVSYETNALTIAPRELRNNNQVLSKVSYDRMALVGLLIPEILLLLGLAICWGRKRH